MIPILPHYLSFLFLPSPSHMMNSETESTSVGFPEESPDPQDSQKKVSL